jgi:hypothetical protein
LGGRDGGEYRFLTTGYRIWERGFWFSGQPGDFPRGFGNRAGVLITAKMVLKA